MNKKIFYLSLAGLILFEIANVYFIMPMPGSQQMNSIGIAYFIYRWRWVFRAGLGLLALLSFFRHQWKRIAWPILLMIIWAGVVYIFNFKMAADAMFYQPGRLLMKNSIENKVDSNRIIIGIEKNGQARAYPIQFIGYHHQVLDSLDGKPVMITYCTVWRTGRVFEPFVNDKTESFRLVGMDHFNAMFEDKSTGSWWRQSTGEAIAGKLKGIILPELKSYQMSLNKWLELYPYSLIMQPDPQYMDVYNSMTGYESGKGKSGLTKTDTISWQNKSWVVGIKIRGKSKAFDWNLLKKERIINDQVGSIPIVLALSRDDRAFVAFERPALGTVFRLRNDSLFYDHFIFDFKGQWLNKNSAGLANNLTPVQASQEYWHSWQTFNPFTEK